MGNVQDARREMTKTKEQLEEEKKISLSIRIKPLDLDAMDHDQLQGKAGELWETIVRLETEKYDLEERQKRQDYDVSTLPPHPHFLHREMNNLVNWKTQRSDLFNINRKLSNPNRRGLLALSDFVAGLFFLLEIWQM